jgi:hypothetical protein
MSIAEAPLPDTRADPLTAAWRVIGSSSTRLVLTALLIAALLLGTWLPQPPVALGTDPAVISRWVNGTAARYGSFGTVLRALGLLDIARAWWYHLLLAALAWHLLIQAAYAAASALLAQGRRGLPAVPQGIGETVDAYLAPPLSDAFRVACSGLSSGGLRVLCETRNQSTATEAKLYADRNRWGLLARALFHVSGLLILIGLLANTVWGWRTGELRMAAGQESDLGFRTEISVRLEEVPSGGQPGEMAFLSDSSSPVIRPLGIARPACSNRICVRQAGGGPSLHVYAHDAAGRLLPLRAEDSDEEPELLLLFDQPMAERLFTVPDAGLAVRVIGVPDHLSEAGAGISLLLQAYQSGSSSPVLEARVDSPATVTIGEISLDVTPQRYAAVHAYHLPGLPWLAIGALLLLLSVTAPLIWPPLQVWVTLASERRAVVAHLVAYADVASIDPGREVERVARALGGDDVKIG